MKGLQYLISLQDKVSNVADRIGGKVRNLVARMNRLQNPVAVSLRDRFSSAADKIRGRVNTLLSGVRSLGTNLSWMNVKLAISAGWNKFSGFVKNATSNIKSFITSAAKVAGVVAGITVAVGAAVMPSVNSALQKSNDERVITFASGKDSQANLDSLYQIVDKFNVPLKETREGFAKTAIAFKDTVLQGKPMRDIFEGVTTSVSAMNMNGEQSGRVFHALTSMMNKGKISMEEISGELGEKLPALTIGARAMGMSVEQLVKKIETGTLSSLEFLPKFAAELKKTFGNEALKAAQSPQAMLNRLKNKFEELKIEVGENLMPTVMRFATRLTEGLQKAVPYVKIVMDWFGKMYDKISPYIEAIQNNLQTAFNSFDGSVLLSYLEKFIVFAASLAQSISGIFAGIAPYLAQIGGSLSQFISPLGNMINSFLSLLGVAAPIVVQVLAWIIDAVDLGGLLGRVFAVLASVFSSVGKVLGVVWNILSPIVSLIIKLVGWIVGGLGGLAMKVLEGVAWAFQKIAQGVEWVYNKIVELLETVGLLDKKTVTVKVQEKIEKVTSIGSGVGGLNPDSFSKINGANTAPAGANASADKINQGGSRPVNISIKYDAMNKGGITINATTLKEGTREIEKLLEEMFLRTLNGATQLATP